MSHAPPAGKLDPIAAQDTMQGDEPKFTWEDLIVDNVTPEEASAWLAPWDWLVSGRVYPVFLSRFGNWFLRRPDGATDLLDVHEGIIERVAPTPEAFDAAVNTLDWQEQFLYSALVMRYRRQGVVARDRDAIAFAPHPALVQSIDACRPMLIHMNAWQAICGQTLRPAAGPDGRSAFTVRPDRLISAVDG